MYEVGHNPNIATDTPPYTNFLGIGYEWSGNDWITWHKSLLKAYGAQVAHDKWLDGWNAQPWMSWDISWLKYDPVFAAYVKANQLDVTNFISDAVVSTENAISNLFGAGEKLTKVLEVAIPVVGGVLILLLIGVAANAAMKSGSSSPTPPATGARGNVGRGNGGKFVKAA